MVIDVMSPYSLDWWSKKCDFYELSLFDNASMFSLSPMAVDIKSVKSCPKKVKRRLNLNAIQANAAGRFLVKCKVFFLENLFKGLPN